MTAKIHGRLGAVDLAATTNTLAYAVPATRKATVTVSICNRNASEVSVRLAHINGAIGTVTNADYIEYNAALPANGVIERSGVVMKENATLMGYCSSANVSIVVAGIEEDA